MTYAGTTATFTPANPLAANTMYTATITTGARDLAGNRLAGNYTWTFTTVRLPEVKSTVPMNTATGVPVNSTCTATFTREMDPASLTTTTMRLTGPGAAEVAGVVTYAGMTATFTPTNPLAGETLYTVTITTGAKDLAGNALASNYTWTFTTGAFPDTTPPVVTSTIPANKATGVPVRSTITATFSKPMDPATLNTDSMQVTGPGATAVAGTVTYAGTTVTFTPANALANGAVYTVTITTAAKDLAGNALVNNYFWTFTTAPLPAVVVPAPTFQDVYFPFNKSILTDEARHTLNQNIEILKANPGIHLRISGYASATGSQAYNLKLSLRRVNAVKYSVHVGGIAVQRLSRERLWEESTGTI